MLKYIAIILVVGILTGCASSKEFSFDLNDFLNKESAQTSDAQISENQESQEPDYINKEVTFQIARDIDTVYPKVKRDFNYKTRDEMLATPQGRWKVEPATGFKHEVVPGSFYHMRWSVEHTFKGETANDVMSVLLEKNGDNTDAVVSYWVEEGRPDVDAYEQSIVNRILALF